MKASSVMRWLAVLVLSTFLAGCASVQPLERTAQPKNSSGYIGGDFTLNSNTFATAFVFVNLETGSQHTLAFTTKREVLAGNNEVVLVELPTGTYRATHWTFYKANLGPASHELKKELAKSKLTEPFRIGGGEVVFLGNFAAESNWSGGTIGPTAITSTLSGGWRGLEMTDAEARQRLAAAYPGFAAQKFVCIACDPEQPR